MKIEKRMEDYNKIYEDFWKRIVENEDGSLNIDQVKRELSDFYYMIEEVPKVYYHVTGGIISKPNTKSSAVISIADENYARENNFWDIKSEDEYKNLLNVVDMLIDTKDGFSSELLELVSIKLDEYENKHFPIHK